MELEFERCFLALCARDARFDGRFFVGVSSTGNYCRPICPARTPRREHCDFFPTAAAAERAGYRPCLRCRPELAPGAAPVDAGGRLAAAVLARIEAGALDGGGLETLARELGVSGRSLRRAVAREYGVAPVQLAQTQRLLLAKRLLTDTTLKVADVAYTSGFSSLRRFNHLFRTRYRLSPTRLRARAARPSDEPLALKLAFRPPLEWEALIGFLAGRGAAGVEATQGRRYLRALDVDGCLGWIAAEPLPDEAALRVRVSETLVPALPALLVRLRALFDLDANPRAIAEHLRTDPQLRGAVTRRPGLRVPGVVDGFELALRAVLGQRISVRAASTLFGRFARRYGDPLTTPHPALTHSGPRPERIAQDRPDRIAALGLRRAQAHTVRALACAVSEQGLRLTPDAPRAPTLKALVELPGIGEWTTQYVAMRALRDADAFPAADLGVLRALGLRTAKDALERAERWRPWRAYAVMHLWQESAGG
jgi:AraC family transcriptional regulator of adaptative response / DNA-3-methyladenine glycosylase II